MAMINVSTPDDLDAYPAAGHSLTKISLKFAVDQPAAVGRWINWPLIYRVYF